ncbi:uncharacterized protein MONOS_18083 [Monocercomonoides exilis]|uniref:uncharacterized protein n=1 Tax=Monocercomonoides exilis TaxID=2049356 RepID=UPI00355A469B|nr:hypothetical protein MONOS_18083 [Monocercomonoides exilis]
MSAKSIVKPFGRNLAVAFLAVNRIEHLGSWKSVSVCFCSTRAAPVRLFTRMPFLLDRILLERQVFASLGALAIDRTTFLDSSSDILVLGLSSENQPLRPVGPPCAVCPVPCVLCMGMDAAGANLRRSCDGMAVGCSFASECFREIL